MFIIGFSYISLNLCNVSYKFVYILKILGNIQIFKIYILPINIYMYAYDALIKDNTIQTRPISRNK